MPEMMHVFGGFKTTQGAHVASERLVQAGIPKESIGVLMSDNARKHFATVEKHTKAPKGAAAGGIAGGVLGGIVAGLTSVAAIAIPGVGVLAAGPIVSILAGSGAGAAAGGALGGLIGLGMTEHEVKHYSDVLRSDGVLVVISTRDRKQRDLARKVLDEAGAVSIDASRGETAHL